LESSAKLYVRTHEEIHKFPTFIYHDKSFNGNGKEHRESVGEGNNAHNLSLLKSSMHNNLEEADLRGKRINFWASGTHD